MESVWLAVANGITLVPVSLIGVMVNKQLSECKWTLKYLRTDIRSLKRQLAKKGNRPHS